MVINTSAYMSGRKKYSKPQGMLWANNSGIEDNGFWIPEGYEIGAHGTDFLILTDDNRSEIDVKPQRIEKRDRMVNGRMRSYHVADKKTISLSWNMIPSRSFKEYPDFGLDGNSVLSNTLFEFTTDGGAGGGEMEDWYKAHTGSFWVYLSYDNYVDLDGNGQRDYGKMGRYNEVIEMFFSDFSYTVVKRGGEYDFWNISVTLEEV